MMNTNLIKIACLSMCLVSLPSMAQDKEQPVVTAQSEEGKKLYAFLDEHFPGKTAELDTFLKEDGYETYKLSYQNMLGIFTHYNKMKKSGNEKLPMLVIEQNKMFMELQPLIDDFEALDADDPKRANMRKKLEPLLAKSNTFGGEWAKVQLAQRNATIAKKKTESETDKKVIAGLEKKIAKMDALRANPKKVFDDYLAYREETLKQVEASYVDLPNGWHSDPAKAMEASKKSGKPIHVFFSATWCGPCQEMKKELCPQKAIKKELDTYESLYVDADKYGRFCRKYNIAFYPSFIVIDAEGKLLRRCKSNAMNAEEFQKWLSRKA